MPYEDEIRSVKVSYWPVQGYTFRLHGGAQRVVDDDRSPFTLGAALTGDHITVEYAFQAFDGEGSAHRLVRLSLAVVRLPESRQPTPPEAASRFVGGIR